MSDEKKVPAGPEAPPLKDLSKKHFQDQIKSAQAFIEKAQQELSAIQNQIQQHIGIINYADHILRAFKLPDAPPEEKKKPELEVK